MYEIGGEEYCNFRNFHHIGLKDPKGIQAKDVRAKQIFISAFTFYLISIAEVLFPLEDVFTPFRCFSVSLVVNQNCTKNS